MKNNIKNFVGVLVCLLVLVSLSQIPARVSPARAGNIIGYQIVTAEDGSVAYTENTYTSAYLAGDFGDLVLQVNNDISGTAAMVVTPQFSNQNGSCGAVTDWADATVGAVSVTRISTNTDSVIFGTYVISKSISGDASTMLRFQGAGRCLRVKMAASTTFTPSVYLWMANTSQ